jgi:hypothetical protein
MKQITASSRTGTKTRGLARVNKTQGMVVAYATAADEVAQDGQGPNSPFTGALLKRLQEPGLEIEVMFRRVAYDVNAQTAGRQRPETYISLRSEYYLNQSDRIVWDRIKDQDDVAALRDFVNKYPSSPNAIFARNRLERLERDAREREGLARPAREEEQSKTVEVEAQRVAREAALRREHEERLRVEELKRQEAARHEALRLQQEVQKRQETLRLQQEERKRQQVLRLEQQADLERKHSSESAAQREAPRQDPPTPKVPARATADVTTPSSSEAQQTELERKHIEENCRSEEARLAELQAGGAAALERLMKFEIETSCEALRPRITAAIAASLQRSGIPEFPWPPPTPSARYVIPRSLLLDSRNSGDASLSDVIRKLERALEGAEYFERSFFAAPDGIAMVTRLERIKPDGTPDYNKRWITLNDSETFSLTNYIKGLLFYDPGYFRLIVFIITNKPFTAAGRSISAVEGSELLSKGYNVLPTAASRAIFSSDHTCTVLIYEFRKTKHGQTRQMNPSDLPARTHLERAMVWAAFGNSTVK